MSIETYEAYKQVMGLTVDVGSRLSLIHQIQKIQKDRGKSTKGFSKMKFNQLKKIYASLPSMQETR
jgi:hypothetical protein